MLFGRTLSSRLLLSLILVSTLPIIIIGYISFKTTKTELTNQVEQNLLISSDNLAAEINSFATERIKDYKILADNPILTDINSSPTEKNKVLEHFHKSNKVYDGIIFTDIKGNVIVDTTGTVIGQNLSQRNWFSPAMKGIIYFSDIYYSKILNKPVLVISGPVRNTSGKIIGVLSQAISLEYFWNTIDTFYLQRKSIGLRGNSFLINNKGVIIAHQDRNMILTNNYLKQNNLTIQKVRAFSANRKIFISSFDNSVSAYASVEPSENFSNEWYVVVSVPRDELYLPLNKLVTKYLFTLTFLLLVTHIIAIYLSKTIEKPIKQLVKATSDFASGKEIPELNNITYEEIQKLNTAFTNMVHELNKKEQEILKSEKLKVAGELAASVAHEIRNPLTTIRGFVQLMQMNNYDDETKKEYCKITIEELDRINEIITNFLILAKPDYRTNFTLADVNNVLKEVLLLEEPQALLLNIEINKNFAPSLPLITADVNQLKQVFINIIQNAFEAISNVGSLTINTTYNERERNIIIQFIDSGKGISDETLKNIGTPFFSTKDGGTGIGLMLCFRIIENMNGTIEIESEVNSGTTVTIKLPV